MGSPNISIFIPQSVATTADVLFNSVRVTATTPTLANQVTSKSYVDAVSAYTAGNGLSLVSKQFSLSAPVTTANGGTGTNIVPVAGQLPVAVSSDAYVPHTLVAGTGIVATFASTPFSLTLSTVQDISTSASPIFGSVSVLAPTAPSHATNKLYVDTIATYTAGNGITLTSKQFSLSAPVTIANGGTGLSTAPTPGQIIFGNNIGSYSLGTISAGTGIAVTNTTTGFTVSTTGSSNVPSATNQTGKVLFVNYDTVANTPVVEWASIAKSSVLTTGSSSSIPDSSAPHLYYRQTTVFPESAYDRKMSSFRLLSFSKVSSIQAATTSTPLMPDFAVPANGMFPFHVKQSIFNTANGTTEHSTG